MRKRHLIVRQCALLLCIAWVATLGATRRAEPPRRELGAGVEYIYQFRPEVPWSIHVVKVDLSRKDLGFVVSLAQGSVCGLQTVSGQVAALPKELGTPLAAVNGDYFERVSKRYLGSLQGLCIRRGELVSAPLNNTCWIDAEGKPHFGDVFARFLLTLPDGTKMRFGLNCAPSTARSQVGAADVVLYTPSFGATTHTQAGREVILGAAKGSVWLPLAVGRVYRAKAIEANEKCNSALAAGTMVLYVTPAAAEKLPAIQPGDEMQIATGTLPDLSGAQYALGGGPMLLMNGRRHPWARSRKRHPRTAIGMNREHFFFVVVDGRQKGLSAGISHIEMAELMQQLGCTEALGLDGGGSTTLWLDGGVVNSPSEGRERPVGNSLVLVRKGAGR